MAAVAWEARGPLGDGLDASAGREAPAKTPPCRHDPAHCPVCQLLVTLAATAAIPPAIPAINEITFERPAPSNGPVAVLFLSTLDARGPPEPLPLLPECL